MADPEQTAYWPMVAGIHRFRIGRPFEAALSQPMRIAVE
jgi:hypothetical protein